MPRIAFPASPCETCVRTFLLCCCLLLAACGQKGDLFLPGQPAAEPPRELQGAPE